MASKSMKARMMAKAKELKDRSEGAKFLTIKEGATRARPLPVGEEKDFIFEVSFIYLNKELGGIVSPTTFKKKCAITQEFLKLNASKKTEDREFAKKLRPKKRGFIAIGKYKDEAGKEPEPGAKPLLLTTGQMQELIDMYLDDETGDFTDKKEGYDVKFKRTGKGQFDTEYNTTPCKPTKLPSVWRKLGEVDIEAMVKAITPSYEETKELLEKFMNTREEDDDQEDESPKKKLLKKKKKKKNRDL